MLFETVLENVLPYQRDEERETVGIGERAVAVYQAIGSVPCAFHSRVETNGKTHVGQAPSQILRIRRRTLSLWTVSVGPANHSCRQSTCEPKKNRAGQDSWTSGGIKITYQKSQFVRPCCNAILAPPIPVAAVAAAFS